MSDWTNICGVIRYDTFEDLDVEKAFGKDLPCGSEGPLNIVKNSTDTGECLTIIGDLRDYTDLVKLANWWKSIPSKLKSCYITYAILYVECGNKKLILTEEDMNKEQDLDND